MHKPVFYKIFILTLFYLLSLPLCANNYHLTVLSSNEGLSQQDVECIAQDKFGFIWIGTYDGLNRYDGNTFKQFRHIPDNDNSISDNRILSLQEWPERDELWIGTDGGGLNCYNLRTAQFSHYLRSEEKENTLTDNQVSCLYKSKDALWIGTSNGPHRLHFTENGDAQIEHFCLKIPGDRNGFQHITWITEDISGNIIAGTARGVYIKSLNENEFRASFGTDSHLYIQQVMKDKAGNMWILSDRKMYFYSASIQKIPGYLSEPYIIPFVSPDKNRRLLPLSENLFLLATENHLYWIRHKGNGFEQEEIHFTQNTFFGNNMLKDLLIDRSMNIWITSQMDGVAHFDLNAKSIYHYPLKYPNVPEKLSVQSLVTDSRQRLWIGSDNGVYIEDFANNKTLHIENISEKIYGIISDSHKNVWINSLSDIYFVPQENIAGIKRIDQNNYNLPDSILPFDGPYAITYDSRRDIVWIGMRSGILQIRNQNGKFSFSLKDIQPYKSLQATNNVTVLHYEETDNSLFIGTKNAGLFHAALSSDGDITTVLPVGCRNREKDEHIWSILKSSDNDIYIGTDSGIKKLMRNSSGEWHSAGISDDSRLQSYKIVSIVEDNDKNLWMGTSMGLLCYSMKTGQVNSFFNTDGLITNILMEGMLFDSSQNRLYVGSIRGLNIVNLSSLNRNGIAPETHFISLKINNIQIFPQEKFNGRIILENAMESTGKIRLKYNENNFSVEFAALHFSNPEKNNFTYQLAGFSDKWTEVNNDIRSATFTNIPPGNYELRVKSSNGDGVWTDEPKTLTISIQPAPWNTVWAYLIYIIVGGCLLYLIYKYFSDKKKIKQEMFVEQLQHKQEMEIAEVKLKYHTNITHELRTPLTLIISPVCELLNRAYKDDYLNSQLHTIKNNADRLLQLINQVLDFRKIVNDKYILNIRQENILQILQEIKNCFSGIAGQKNILIESYNDLLTDYGWCDREIITKICSNLLSNALKYTPERGKISIYASQNSDNTKLFISIEDTGTGIDEKETDKIFNRFYQVPGSTGGTGVGLNLCRQLAQIHQGKISVKSRLGEGSIFTLEIPVDKNAFSEECITEPPANAKKTDAGIQDGKAKPVLLIVEDNQELCRYMQNLLEEDAKVILARNGEEGYNLAVNTIPDMIISDIMMPVMDGIELMQKCKEDIRTSHIPIILLTAKETNESEIEGLAYGANDYITKPFNPHILKLRIRNLLSLTMKQKAEAEKETKHLNDRERNFLETFEKIILGNLSVTDFGMEEICSIMAMSRMQLYRKMIAVINKKPSEYIKEIKMKRACELMKTKGLNITEVMYEIGYSNYSYFSRRFTEINGISPREILGMQGRYERQISG